MKHYMLQYDRIEESERTDANKTDSSSEYIIGHYLYFIEINFTFQPGFNMWFQYNFACQHAMVVMI